MDEQVEILRGIWSEMKALNGRVDTLNGRVEGLNDRVDKTNESLRREMGALRSEFGEQLGGLRTEIKEEIGELRIDLKTEARRNVERDLRLGTAIAELSLDVRELTGIVHSWRDEHRIDREDLRERVARLERRVGLEPP